MGLYSDYEIKGIKGIFRIIKYWIYLNNKIEIYNLPLMFNILCGNLNIWMRSNIKEPKTIQIYHFEKNSIDDIDEVFRGTPVKYEHCLAGVVLGKSWNSGSDFDPFEPKCKSCITIDVYNTLAGKELWRNYKRNRIRGWIMDKDLNNYPYVLVKTEHN